MANLSSNGNGLGNSPISTTEADQTPRAAKPSDLRYGYILGIRSDDVMLLDI
jgi:hypothetical protein